MSDFDHVPSDIDREAVAILIEAGFRWEPATLGFRRRGSVIDYQFLRAQRLVADSGMTAQDRIGQLLRLRILIQGID